MSADAAVQWRPITAADGAEWARLVLAIEESYGTEEILGADDLLADLRDPDVDPERGTIAVIDQGSMVAYAGLRSSPAATGRHEMDLYGGVHPGYRGRGLGTHLLAWAERAALPLHQARYGSRPLALSAHCPAGQSDAVALFATAGYQQARWFHFMSRDLADAGPDDLPPEGARIVQYTAELSEVARRIRDEAFRDHWGSTPTTPESWQHFVSYQALRPAFSALAYVDDHPAGVLIAHEYDAFTQVTGRRESYIATVGVTTAARGRGIASALIHRSLAAARSDGCTAATLHVDAESPTGALTLYERLGFTTQNTSVTLIKDLTEQHLAPLSRA